MSMEKALYELRCAKSMSNSEKTKFSYISLKASISW